MFASSQRFALFVSSGWRLNETNLEELKSDSLFVLSFFHYLTIVSDRIQRHRAHS